MSHVTFYRKYRSKTFSELEGQEHIIQTLSNALKFQRLSHAYVFSGPRGTGKTSTARILAKALNCRNGVSFSPCLSCDLCEKIALGQAVDVLEIDAASNTGVDNIRTLNEQVNFAPVEGRYKIYIIDEVHMLSTGAFNALLKTLEEPPQNTVFILATTESHKIPATIHSRCQHLHFRKLTSAELVSQLKKIAQAESISITDAGLFRIARQAGGCMRDAVSLFDQVYSFKGATISEEDIVMMLGGSDFDLSCTLIKSYFEGEVKPLITQLQTFFLQGGNVIQLVSDLSNIVKQLMYIQLKLDQEIELDQSRLTELRPIAEKLPFAQMTQLLENFSKLEMELRWFPNPELLLEVRFLTLMAASSQPQAQPVSPVPVQRQIPAQAAPQPVHATMTRPTAPAPAAFSPPRPPEPVRTPAPPAPAPAMQAAAPVQPVAGGTAEKWMGFLTQLKAQRPPLFSILDKSQVLGVTNGVILIRLKQDFKFFRDKLKEDAHKALISQLLQEQFGQTLVLGFADESAPQVQEVSPAASVAVDQPQSQTQNPTMAAPTVQHAAPVLQDIPSHSQKINEIVALFEGKVI